MAEPTIIDMLPQFLSYWERVRGEPIGIQIEKWATEYMLMWPGMAERQILSYQEEGHDWRDVARTYVFPHLESWLPAMVRARDNLLDCLPEITRVAHSVSGGDLDAVCILYVGIGCGAGWATMYRGRPAILFGLEKIAELHWDSPDLLRSLACHELAHLIHGYWRAVTDASDVVGGLGTIYSEGFAERFEELLTGRQYWVQEQYQPGWLSWCSENRSWLASEYLRLVDDRGNTTPFFGDWVSVRGHSQCGYYLGHEIILDWESEHDIRSIASMHTDDVYHRIRSTLRRMSEG